MARILTEEAKVRRREAQRKFREKNPGYYARKMAERKAKDPQAYAAEVRRIALRASYGIAVEDYEALFKKQQGRCAICGTKDPGQHKKHLCVDHDHGTGKVRGLLCQRCNRALGLLKDDIKLIDNAATYLRSQS